MANTRTKRPKVSQYVKNIGESIKNPKVMQYTKNVAKSVAFASISTIKDNTPGIASFMEANEEIFTEVYASVKNYRETIKKIDKDMRNSNLFKAIEYGTKNLIEDAKSGNFYNDRTYNNAESILGIDDDFSFDYEVSGGYEDSEEYSSHDTISPEKYLSDSFNESIGAAAIGNSTAIAQGTDMVIRGNKASTMFISGQIQKSTATIHSGIGAVYESTNKINQFLNGPMMAHLENSRTYYENSLKIMQEQQAMTKEMLEMQRNLYKKQDNSVRNSKLDQAMEYDGSIDIKGYAKIVKGNITNILDTYGLGGLLMGGDTGMNIPMMFASAPLKMIMDMAMDGIMPKNIKNSLKSFDSSITTLFSNFITKMNHSKNDFTSEIKSFLGDIFGIGIEDKKDINTANYDRGPIPFDGITKKTIVEVIPGYLARIESALTGSDERFFDPYKGTWKSSKQIEEDFDEEKIRAIQTANRDINRDTYDLVRKIRENEGDEKADELEKKIQGLMTKIFEDKGYFNPSIKSQSKYKTDANGRRIRESSGRAWEEYGFDSPAQFNMILSAMTDETFKNLAVNNMRSMQNYSRTIEQHEKNGGTYNILYNGTFDETGEGLSKRTNPSAFNKFAKNNLLNLSKDETGHNIFYYLREILSKIGRNGSNDNDTYTPPTDNGPVNDPTSGGSTNRESSTPSEESEGDSGSSEDGDPWAKSQAKIEEEERKKKEKENKKHIVDNWITKKLEKTAVGKFVSKSIKGVADIFSKPMKYASELLDKANENIFAMIFGDKELRDENGKKINNVLEYMINKIKKSFDELTKWIKTRLKDIIDPIWKKVKPNVQPVIDELKSMGKTAGNRVKQGLNNTFGKVFGFAKNEFDSYMDEDARAYGKQVAKVTDQSARDVRNAYHNRQITKDQWKAQQSAIRKKAREDRIKEAIEKVVSGNVVSADEVAGTATVEDKSDPGVITENAFGNRFVTKRGLTMISPGEMIIPASFDKEEQNKMLDLEKKDKRRILDYIGLANKDDIDLNAKGNTNSEKVKKDFEAAAKENKGKGSKNIASSIIGAGASLFAGIDPIIGAIVGAGVSIIRNSETLQNAVFGKEVNGEREGGLIPKKIQDTFKKYVPDMTDYGIAGGVLGLFTPFGPLGGAAIGAGIGFLKNSESFKKFIFGDESTGEDGLIKKESYDKFKAFVKKAAPNMLIGAGAGILAGPFGLLGNAAMGAGFGLISSTDQFHKLIFGDPENGTGGVIDALKTGLLDPAKEKFYEFAADFKDYAKKNIIEPMKNFWKPFNQMIKNVIQNTGNAVKDIINDIFEKSLGLPLHDFLQEKIFKPIGKVVFGILKAPVALGKAIVAAPFKAAQGIGNSIRASQIRRGTAYDMSASERLAWRDEHNIRFNKFNAWKDKNRKEDEILADKNEEELRAIITNAGIGLHSRAALQKRAASIKRDVGRDISGFFNAKDDSGKNKFNRVNFNTVNKLTKIAQNGDADKVNEFIDGMKGLTDDEKADLKKRITVNLEKATDINNQLNSFNKSSSELDKEMAELIGRKFKGRSDRRKLYRSAEAELKSRRKTGSIEEESQEVKATYDFAEIYKTKTDKIIELFIASNEYLKNILNPNANKTSPPSDIKNTKDEILNDGNNASETFKSTNIVEEAASVIEEKNKKKTVNISNTLTIPGTPAVAAVDEDSKEATELRVKAEEDEKEEAENVEANKKTVSILEVIKNGLLGRRNSDEEDTGFVGKLLTGIGKFGKFIGMTGLALTGVSLFGHASKWFKTSIWPKIKEVLFGTTNDDGTRTTGLLGGVADRFSVLLFGVDGNGGAIGKIKTFLLGDGNEPGLLGRARDWLATKINGIADWFSSKGGLVGIFTNHIIPGFINGIGYAINNLVAPLTTALLKALPSLLIGLGGALLKGITAAIFKKELKDTRGTEITDGGAADAISAYQDSVNNSVESSGTGVHSSVKSAWSNLKVSLTGGSKTLDISNNYDTNVNDKKSNSILGLLGQTKRTNTIEYDENGNIITDYTRWNTTDSLASRGAKVAGRGFLKGLAGNFVAKAVEETAEDVAKSGAASDILSALGNIIKGKKAKATGDTASAVTKAGKAIIDKSGKAGSALKNIIDNIASKVKTDSVDIIDNKTGEVVKTVTTGKTYQTNAEILEDLFKSSADDVASNAATKKSKTIFDSIKSGASKVKNFFTKNKITPNTTETGLAVYSKNALATVADTATDKATKNGILSDIKHIFDWIADSKIISWICDKASKMTSKEVTEAVVKKAINAIGDRLGTTLLAKATKASLKAVGNIIAKFSPVSIITFVADFWWGCDNAYTILGVTKDSGFNVTFGHKCLCGLTNMLTNFFTLGIIPADTIMDIVAEFIFPIFGIDTEGWQQARDKSQSILDTHNYTAEDGDKYDNLQDYNNKDKWWYKINKGFNNVTTTIKENVKTGVSNAVEGVKNFGTNVAEGAKTFSTNAVEGIKNFGANLWDSISSFGASIADITKFISSIRNDAIHYGKTGEHLDSVKIDENDPLCGIKKVILTIGRVMTFPLAVKTKLFATLQEKVFDPVTDGLKNISSNVGQGVSEIFSAAWNGDIKKTFSTKIDSKDSDNTLTTGISNVILSIVKTLGSPIILLTGVVGEIKRGFDNFIDGAQQVIPVVSTAIGNKISNAWNPNSELKDQTLKSTGNTTLDAVAAVVYGIGNYFTTPIALLGKGVNVIKDGFTVFTTASSKVLTSVKNGINNMMTKAGNGDLSGLTSSLGSVTGNPTLDTISETIYAASKIFTTIPALISAGMNSVKNGIQVMVNKYSVAKKTKVADDNKITKALNGQLDVFSSTYWTNASHSGEGVFGIIANIQTYLEKVINAPIAIIKKIGNTIAGAFEDMKEWFEDSTFGNIWEWVSGFFAGDGRSKKVDTSNYATGPDDNSAWANARGRTKNIRYGKGHVYQSNGSIANIKYGDSTIGESGCAPVAATNLLNSISYNNKNNSIIDAAKFAETHSKTVPGGGTDISYFNSYLGSKGIPTFNTMNKDRVMNALMNGDQVIMLGRDNNDNPGAPFGTTPHFITAKGISNNGNIIAEDPDLPQNDIEYDPSVVMNSMINSVIADTNANNTVTNIRNIIKNRRRRRPSLNSIIRSGRAHVARDTSNEDGTVIRLGSRAVINVAASQIGTNEKKTNKVKYNHAYYGSNVSGDAYKWCCAFVWWVFNQSGASKLFYGGDKTAYCPTLLNYYKERGKFDQNPKPGDIVFFSFGGTRADHVGIVVKDLGNGKVRTIEGNTGSDNTNGGGVLQRDRSTTNIIGYAHPDYPYIYDASSVVDMSKYGDNTDYLAIARSNKSYTGIGVTSDSDGYSDDTYYSSDDEVSSTDSSSESKTNTIFDALTNLGKNMIKTIFGENAYNALYGSIDSTDSDTGESDTSDSTTSTGITSTAGITHDAKQIWNGLRNKGYSKAGVAGIMGNLNAESGLYSNNLQNSYNNSLGYSDDEYSNKVSSGAYSKNKFMNDSAGYGLAQWTHHSRKRGLYEATVEQGKRIDDLQGQIDYLANELNTSYSSLNKYLKATDDVTGATDKVLYQFENPANPEGSKDKRRSFAQTFYNTYGKGRTNTTTGNARTISNESISNSVSSNIKKLSNINYSDTTAKISDAVSSSISKLSDIDYTGIATKALNSISEIKDNISNNYSNSTVAPTPTTVIDYATFLKTIVEILISISSNTALLSKILEILSSKFDIDIDKSEVEQATKNSKAQAERALDKLLTKSSDASTYAKLINNKDTQYLVSAMAAIAGE